MPQPDIQNKRYKKLLEKRRAWYKSIGSIYCLLLKEDIIFNSKGFYHLIYPSGIARPIKERMYKLGLLPLVIPTIRNATKIHKREQFISKKSNKQTELVTLKEIVGVQSTEVTVVLRRIGAGNLTFLSVSKKQDRAIRNKLMGVLKIKKTTQGRRWFF